MTNEYKLTREQFADALAKGLGRAMLYIKHYGLDNVKDIVLEACIHNTTYDVQCEDVKAQWLYEMFKDTSHYNDFRAAILAAMKEKNEWHDAVGLCDLATEMALDGDELAKETLRAFVLNAAANEKKYFDLGIYEYIRVGGEQAVLELAKIYGQRLIDNPEDSVPETLTFEDENRVKFAQLLQEQCCSDNRIKVYFDYANANGGLELPKTKSQEERAIDWENTKNEFLSTYNAEKIIETAVEGSIDSMSFYRRYGIFADESDLKLVLSRLPGEQNNEVRKRLLWVFGKAAMPIVDERIFEWANSDNAKFRAAILIALANCEDDKVHDFACARLKVGKIIGWPDHLVFDIFSLNYSVGDAKLIMDTILASKADKHDIHSFGLSITSIAEENKTNELKELLIWVYENTPCSNCREQAVDRLKDIEALSQEIIDECLCDGFEEIREFVRNMKNQ
ncbi:MAG: hypothetical protein A2Y10_13485 [Planctomycetes bacterium GWF2_41_51]|nr:MAG: hypothetical protein A2Y10_13485 [Planctomycetes bacterium GWF2_41_51]HBG26169.1 hypothetical protein [Phycisphaerales bacterium]